MRRYKLVLLSGTKEIPIRPRLNPPIIKHLFVALVAASIVTGCGKKEQPQATAEKEQAAREQKGLEYRMAKQAVELLYDHADFLTDLGGNPSLTPENLAEKLAESMNSAGTAIGADLKTQGPKFTYVAHQVTGPWQVVFKVEDQTLRATAYGSDQRMPLEQRGFELSRR